MFEIRRDTDGELCGFVVEGVGEWSATTVFGGQLGSHSSRADAERQVREMGLAALADRWTLIDGTTGEEQTVSIQESTTSRVTVALGYYSLPGVPTLTLTTRELNAGRWTLTRG